VDIRAAIGVAGFFLASLSLCRGNLGDTLDQCIARYGKEMPPNGITDPARIIGQGHIFQKDGIVFEEYISNGIVQCESMTKADGSLFSEKERNDVVQAESAGGKWNDPVTAKGQEIWLRADGAALSCPLAYPEIMMVVSKDYYLSEKAKSKATFPTEADVKSFVVVGMKEEDVTNRFGIPMTRDKGADGGEVLQYNAPPSSKKMTFGYAGFEVFCKNGLVTDLEIIHATVR
jgi:hypothetical protein